MARSGASLVATGHHADDRAETVLMRLLRGAAPSALAVLAPCAPPFVRPFVRARRTAIAAHVSRHAIPHAQDPSNHDPRFLRARVRNEVVPLLERLNPGVVPHLCALADAIPSSETPAYLLPRATHEALRELARDRSPRTRIALPGGLMATVCPDEHRSVRARRPRPLEGTL
jgi:tRNA(Ile)-lysidine synthase